MSPSSSKATTILTLLQEVSQFASPKVDWNTLVKRTSTGITSACEYQMIWRHLAYKHILQEKIDDGAELLDDESDLEFEVEAVPVADEETSSEVAACVKVLCSSGSEPGPISTNAEAPLAQNIPDQKQSLPVGTTAEELDGNGPAASSGPPKKKRKLWTKEEDMELIAAVQKCGEGNWASILKGDFKHDRTPSQLSQRWGVIKRQASLNQNNGNKSSSLASSEERKAAQKALSLAINMPMTGSLPTFLSGATNLTSQGSSTMSATLSEATPSSTPHPLNQLLQSAKPLVPQKTLNPLIKPLNTSKKQAASNTKASSIGPNPLIQAAAFAAGGRIATPSTAASLLKAAQSKSAFHIRPRGLNLSSSVATLKPSLAATINIKQPLNARHVRPVTAPSPPVVNSGTSSTSLKEKNQEVQAPEQAIEQTVSTTKISNSQDNTKQGNGNGPASINVDESLTKEVGDADTKDLDESKANDQPTVSNSVVTEATEADENKTVSNGAGGAQVSSEHALGPLTEAACDSGGMNEGKPENQVMDPEPKNEVSGDMDANAKSAIGDHVGASSEKTDI
ncbi:uncharacterized protein LOC109726508 isoform X2 [Ananas comosus]|uniref:Uncharacterized protein LOC109726508 isoform X2 n=1 Tax=Ananas comosus TaxID=4615 RepID=A0A6P5H1D5_ANACO|nr:uncharacterized protein LOC109726508 isoform X2 [Ananas comosus]